MGDEGASGHKSGSRLIISATGPPAPGIHHHQPTETIFCFMEILIYKLLQIVLQFVSVYVCVFYVHIWRIISFDFSVECATSISKCALALGSDT